VVEAVDLVTAEVEGAGEAAEARAALDHRRPRALLGETECQRNAENPAADDADAGRDAVHQPWVTGARRAAAAPSIAVAAAGSGSPCGAVASARGETGGGWMRPTMCAAITRK
jgi:hypothetical protein